MRELIINSTVYFIVLLILNVILVIITSGFIEHHITLIVIISLILGIIKSHLDANYRENTFRSIKEELERKRLERKNH